MSFITIFASFCEISGNIYDLLSKEMMSINISKFLSILCIIAIAVLASIVSLSTAYISQVNKIIEMKDVPLSIVIQLDITLGSGNSDGQILDLFANVLGLTNAGTSYGLNFSTLNIIIRTVASLLEGFYYHSFCFYLLPPKEIMDKKYYV